MQGLQTTGRKGAVVVEEPGTVRLADGEEMVRFDPAPLDGLSAPPDPREAALQLRHMWRVDPRRRREI